MSNEITLVPEIMGTAAGLLEKPESIEKFKTEPREFLKYVMGADLGSTQISVVENSGSEMNLCLPYYSDVVEGRVAMHDDSMIGVIGGLAQHAFTRNRHQFENNTRLAFMGRYSAIDNSYDGDFDIDTDASWFPHQDPEVERKK